MATIQDKKDMAFENGNSQNTDCKCDNSVCFVKLGHYSNVVGYAL